MAVEEREYTLPNQITPELRAAYEALEAAAVYLVSVMTEPWDGGWITDLNDALAAVDAAKRAAP